MTNERYYLVSSEILPPAIEKVILAKELLESKQAQSTTQAVKMAGISRSVFYKYRDRVFKYDALSGNVINLSALLSDRTGVFSSMTAVLCKNGANIITVNQSAPVNGAASVVLTVQTDKLCITLEELIDKLKNVDGILSVSAENGKF